MSSACPFSTATEASNRADPYPFLRKCRAGRFGSRTAASS